MNVQSYGPDESPIQTTWQVQLQALLRQYVTNWEPLYEFLVESGRDGIDPYEDGHVICNAGDPADVLYLIIEGQVDLLGETGTWFKARSAGALIGEQAFLLDSQPGSAKALRTISLRAHGTVQLITFHSDLLSQMTTEIKALWFEFMAHLVNEKLVEASHERVSHIEERIAKSHLLSRFCDKEALSLVELAVAGGPAQAPVRETITWFSDIAGFSGWSKGREPLKIAAAMKQLMGLQVELIHEFGGGVDKLMGDGLMGFWFLNELRPEIAEDAVRCAKRVIEEFDIAIANTDMADLSLRIGLHNGKVCFGDFGTEDRIAVTLIGEPVNLAARYE